MAEKSENIKNGIAVQKTFFSVGPTLRYSHSNVRFFWTLSLLVYIGTLLFWSKLITGDLVCFAKNWSNPEVLWGLSEHIKSPINIFNYPEHIFVLGGLMGILAITPVLVSQLMSLKHCLPFIICSAVLGMPVAFSLTLLVSCFAAASRPLRFRSRIISLALCLTPQAIYWSVFGSIENVDPIKTGLAYSPWLFAWFCSLLIAGAVLAVGHLTRYRPGLVFLFTLISLTTSVVVFQRTVSLAELDYQLYIAGNDPDKFEEFYEQDLSTQIDAMVNQILTDGTPFGFYPTERDSLRKRLISDIQNELRRDRWLRGFERDDKFNYQKKRNDLLEQYTNFINPPKKWWMPQIVHNWLTADEQRQDRLPIALYYKGILSDMEPDIMLVEQKEILRFKSKYPHRGSLQIWVRLYKDFGDSPESIEARWRIAKSLAGEGQFDRAEELCDISLNMIEKQLIVSPSQIVETGKIFAVFKKPAKTVMDTAKLDDLKFRINELKSIINIENHQNIPENNEILAKFIMLNPNELDYLNNLEDIAKHLSKDSPLLDNIMLAKALMLKDTAEQSKELKNIADTYPKTDSGIHAIYELAVLRVNLWQKLPEDDQEIKTNYLLKAKEILNGFITANPEHYLTDEAAKILNSLPEVKQ
jgi:tetratricopeptide (TPR) repeat protein